jgi:hypothetical protein
MYQACKKPIGSGFLWVDFETLVSRASPCLYDKALKVASTHLWRASFLEKLPKGVLVFYERLKMALHGAMHSDLAFCQNPCQSAKKSFDELLSTYWCRSEVPLSAGPDAGNALPGASQDLGNTAQALPPWVVAKQVCAPTSVPGSSNQTATMLRAALPDSLGDTRSSPCLQAGDEKTKPTEPSTTRLRAALSDAPEAGQSPPRLQAEQEMSQPHEATRRWGKRGHVSLSDPGQQMARPLHPLAEGQAVFMYHSPAELPLCLVEKEGCILQVEKVRQAGCGGFDYSMLYVSWLWLIGSIVSGLFPADSCLLVGRLVQSLFVLQF